MTCPNIPPDARPDATGCNGNGLIDWPVDGQQHPVPCGWCWKAAGYSGPYIPTIPMMVRLRVARDQVLSDLEQPALFDAGGPGPEFDGYCNSVRRAGVTDELRDAWLAWIDSRTVEVAS